jgi:hypothetical protein
MLCEQLPPVAVLHNQPSTRQEWALFPRCTWPQLQITSTRGTEPTGKWLIDNYKQ